MIETWFSQDLNEPVQVHQLDGNVFSQDNQGNLVGVNVFDGDDPATLSGSVSASVIRSDGSTVAVTGVLSGNSCYVILPSAAYALPGIISIVIKLTGGGSTTTLCAVVANVYQSATDATVDPGTIIPSVQALIDEIENAISSIPLDYSTLSRYAEVIGIQYGLYDYDFINKPYDCKNVFAVNTVSAINPSGETYGDGSRAVARIDSIVNGNLFIFNPSKNNVAIYYRRKSDNQYIGYAKTETNSAYVFVSGLDNSVYNYYIMLIHKTGATETNWTQTELEEANKKVFVYSGDYNDNQKALSLKVESNLIRPSIIHTGKYYYGGALPADNPNMSYTDLIPIKGKHRYFFPYVTIGYSWYEQDGITVIGGNYIAVENVSERLPYVTLDAPEGAAYLGVSVRSGDVPNMILSELPNSKSHVSLVSGLPVVKSVIAREPLNWIFNTDYKQTMGGSRLVVENGSFDGEKVSLPSGGIIACKDQICMDKSKVSFVFAVPGNESPSFVLGTNGYYANPSLAISDGAIAVWFKSDGTAEIRTGTGQSGTYSTFIKSLDISDLDITSGRKFILSIEKDTINRYIISVYDALTPNVIAETEIQAQENEQDHNLFVGQIRGWGGPFAIVNSGGNVEIYNIKMYSTAPTYPKVAFWGDSYIENMGRNPLCSYANLLRNALNGDAFSSGQGGATAAQTSYRFAAEINSCSPQYIVFNVGVNDSFNVGIETYKTSILHLVDLAKNAGAVPILVTIPNVPAGNETTAAFCEQANLWIRSLGYDYIDIAYALSTGDGTTGDTTKFVSDMTHPNIKGGKAIFDYIKANLPHLLWK